MRVLLITTDIDRAETNMFLKLLEKEITLEVICDPDSAAIEQFKQAGISVTPLTITKRFQKSIMQHIQHKLSHDHFDIVHVLRKIALSNVLWATRRHPVKIVAYRGIPGNLSTLDPFSWMTFLHPRVDRVICVAEAVRQGFLKMGLPGLRLRSNKFITIHKGHDIQWYRQENPPRSAQMGLPEGVPLVGTVANFRSRKGADVFIKAYEYLPRDVAIQMVLIGEVKDKNIYRVHQRSPYKDNIHLMGKKPDAWLWMNAFQLFVVPSLRREGLPRALIEAMAQGVPPIVTDVGGSSEVVIHNQTGLVIPPNDPKQLAKAITTLIRNPHLAQALGRNAVKRIHDDFNLAKTVHLTWQLYCQLLTDTLEQKPLHHDPSPMLRSG